MEEYVYIYIYIYMENKLQNIKSPVEQNVIFYFARR
jgi:hypothetical protein